MDEPISREFEYSTDSSAICTLFGLWPFVVEDCSAFSQLLTPTLHQHDIEL